MVIFYSLLTLGIIGCVAAVLLYFIAQKFKVEEDPRIDDVEAALPGANCGGCGFPGCRGMAEACVKASSLEGLLCPVGGQDVMQKIAGILGMEAAASEPKIAVVRCNGSCDVRPKTSSYDGPKSCAVAAATFAGETGCAFGCLGFGDCVAACQFDAIHINPETGLPEVDEDKCVACGACAKACPKLVIELRKKGRLVKEQHRRLWVQCVNKDKGAPARKACKNACIGCAKCQKVCKFDAITVENNLAYIDPEKCKACGMCFNECPTGAIHASFDVPKPKPKPAPEATAPVAPKAEAPKAPEATAPIAPKAEAPKAPEAAAPVAPKAEAQEMPKADNNDNVKPQNKE